MRWNSGNQTSRLAALSEGAFGYFTGNVRDRLVEAPTKVIVLALPPLLSVKH
jgi:hypothetical protein